MPGRDEYRPREYINEEGVFLWGTLWPFVALSKCMKIKYLAGKGTDSPLVLGNVRSCWAVWHWSHVCLLYAKQPSRAQGLFRQTVIDVDLI